MRRAHCLHIPLGDRCPLGWGVGGLGQLLRWPPGIEVGPLERSRLTGLGNQVTYHIVPVFPLHLREVNATVVRFPSLFSFFILAAKEDKEK